MSGFELEHRSLKSGLSGIKETAVRATGETVNRELLSKLRQSGDIASDLMALYSDRPYMYARVMQQLGKVLGKTKLRSLHNEVVSRAKIKAQRARLAADTLKKSLKSSSHTSSSEGATNGKDNAKEQEKEFKLNVPALGLKNTTVRLGDGQATLSSSDLPIPVLKNISGNVSYNSELKVNKVTVHGNLNMPYIAESAADITLTRNPQTEAFTPSGNISAADIKIPGLGDGVKASFSLATSAEDTKLQGTLSGTGKLFNTIAADGSGKVTSDGSTTDFDGNLSLSTGTAAKGASAGAKQAAAQGAAQSGPMTFSGNVELKTSGENLSGIRGDLSVGNLGILADPADTVDLEVTYADNQFSANLTKAINFKTHEISAGGQAEGAQTQAAGDKGDKGGSPSTVQLTINEASYSEDSLLHADCTAHAMLGGLVEATGNVIFDQNVISSGTVTAAGEGVKLLPNRPYLIADFTGNVDIDESGFKEAGFTGTFHVSLGKQPFDVTLDNVVVDANGNFSGEVSSQDITLSKELKINTFSAKFSSTSGLESAEGTLSIDAPSLKTKDENGIQLSYDGNAIQANGILALIEGQTEGGKGSEIATCEFNASMTPEDVSGSGLFTLTADYRVGQSKLELLSGCTAELAIRNGVMDPIKFNGKYQYGHVGGAGQDGQEAQSTDGGQKGGDKNAAAGPLMFNGELNACVFDINTGNFDGKASVKLESDIVYKNSFITVSIPAERRQRETVVNATIASSKIETLSGTVTYIVDIPLKKDNLKVEGALSNFTLDVPNEKFSGKSFNKLTENYDLYTDGAGNKIVLLGNQQCGINFDIAENEITGMDIDAVADLTVVNSAFEKGKEKFRLESKDASIDLETLALNAPKASISAQNGATVILGKSLGEGKDTKIAFDKGAGIEATIENSLVQSITVQAGFTGDTGIFKSQERIAFKGNSSLELTNIQSPEMTAEGEISVKTSKDTVLDSIDKFDKITLLAKSGFGLKVSDNQLEEISGDFLLKYELEKGANQYLPNGFAAKLTGKNLVYKPASNEFSGDIGVSPTKDIKFAAGTGSAENGASASFTLKKKGTGLTAHMEQSKLKKLGGTAGFEASAELNKTKGNAKVDFTDGIAKLDLDVDTGNINSLSVNSKAALNTELSDKLSVASKDDCTVEANFDNQGLVDATFKGTLEITLNIAQDKPLKLALSSESGLKYSRDAGFNGDVKLACVDETVLGKVSHNGGKTYEFGLTNVGKGNAAEIQASIANNDITKLSGSSGLFLRESGGASAQEGEDNTALNVTGNLTFDYDVPSNTLLSAEGEVTIARKLLSQNKSGEKLFLGESKAKLLVTNNQLNSVSGVVNLSLADEKGDYLAFKSAGEFDCIDTKEVNGTVTATVVRDKQLTGAQTKDGIDFYLSANSEYGASSMECTIKDSAIESIKGSVGFLVKKDGKDFFAGCVTGEYLDGMLNASGKITLKSNIPLPEDGETFELCEGSYGEAVIKDNNLDTIRGALTVKIKGPKTAEKENGGAITVTAESSLDVANGTIEEFEGKASLDGEFELAKGLSLTSLGASVKITNNVLEKITGQASVKYEKAPVTIVGDCSEFSWEKGKGDAEDTIAFKGSLDVTAYEDKIHGNVGIDYDSSAKKLDVEGEVDFKITDWLGGKVSLKFENGNWDEPIISGQLDVTDAELIAGRSLLSFSKKMSVDANVMAGPVPLTFGAGIGLGLNVDMKPVLFNATIAIKDYKVRSAKGIPEFSADMKLSSGVELKATLAPYAQVGVGISQLSAGLRLKGVGTFAAATDLAMTGKLSGGEEGLAGELGLGLDVSGNFSVDVMPQLYANLFGNDFSKDIAKWHFDLGELFKFSWGKKFTFGEKGTQEAGEAEKTPVAAASEKVDTATDSTTSTVDAMVSDYNGKAANQPEAKEMAPQLPDAKTVGEQAGGDKIGDDPNAVAAGPMDHIKNVAAAVQSIAEAVKLISGIVSAAIATGPAGALIYVAIKILTGEITLEKIKNGFNNIKKGIESIKALLQNPGDLLRSILPSWVFAIYDFFKNATMQSIVAKVVDSLEKKINGMSFPYNKILQPLVNYARGQQKKIGEIGALFLKGDPESIIKGVLKILGFAFTSITDLVKMVADMASIFMGIVRDCIQSGDIYVKHIPQTFIDYYYWQVKIPGMCNFKGEGDNLATKGIVEAICLFLPVKKQKIKKK